MKEFIKQPSVKYVVIIFVSMLAVSILVLLFNWSKLPPQVPLYYSLPWGEQQLAAPWELSILPTFAVSIFLTNLFLSYLLVRDNDLILKILLYTSLFVAGLLLYSLVRVVFLVT
jgi:hypothetical protein